MSQCIVAKRYIFCLTIIQLLLHIFDFLAFIKFGPVIELPPPEITINHENLLNQYSDRYEPKTNRYAFNIRFRDFYHQYLPGHM